MGGFARTIDKASHWDGGKTVPAQCTDCQGPNSLGSSPLGLTGHIGANDSIYLQLADTTGFKVLEIELSISQIEATSSA